MELPAAQLTPIIDGDDPSVCRVVFGFGLIVLITFDFDEQGDNRRESRYRT